MANDTTLAVSYEQLQKIVGRFLGYGRGITGADDGSTEWADIEECIQSGLRQFYSPPPLPGKQEGHEWHFLRPTASLSLVADQGDYDLPASFGGLIGVMTFDQETSVEVVRCVGEGNLRKLRQYKSRSGLPQYVAIRPKITEGDSQQGFEAMFWPTPNSTDTVYYRYFVLPKSVDTDNPYPYGANAHAETIIESCLSIAEQRFEGEKGLHWEKFLERLAASVNYDQKTSREDYFGYNGDSSDISGDNGNERVLRVKVNGVYYDNT